MPIVGARRAVPKKHSTAKPALGYDRGTQRTQRRRVAADNRCFASLLLLFPVLPVSPVVRIFSFFLIRVIRVICVICGYQASFVLVDDIRFFEYTYHTRQRQDNEYSVDTESERLISLRTNDKRKQKNLSNHGGHGEHGGRRVALVVIPAEAGIHHPPKAKGKTKNSIRRFHGLTQMFFTAKDAKKDQGKEPRITRITRKAGQRFS